MNMDLLKESIAQAAEDHGVALSPECLKDVAEAVIALYEYSSYDHPVSDSQGEVRKLEAELECERAKVICKECHGTGIATSYGPSYKSTSRCWKCNGTGKVAP